MRLPKPKYPKFPTHLTLPPEERPVRVTAFLENVMSRSGHGGRSKLLKQWDCIVEYPDGTPGRCKYERKGPAWHVFTYLRNDDGLRPHISEGKYLAVVTRTEPMPNTPDAIDGKGKELAETAFWRAVEQERRNWFARATPTESHIPNPRTFRMSAGRAKQIGGKYALCLKIGDALLPMSAIVDTLPEACDLWRKRPDSHNVVVGCCCRLDRNWQLCELNPLTKEGHPKRGDNGSESGGKP